jgi:hypothetical protein
MRAPISTAVAISVGILVLLGLFLPIPLLQNVRVLLLGWAVTLTGLAALMGVISLIITHWRKLQNPKGKDYYSVLVIMAFIITVGIGIVLGPQSATYQSIITAIQVPVEASLMAILAISLVYISLRLLQKRAGMMAWVFVLSALAYLLLSSGFLAPISDLPVLGELIGVLHRLPVAGARGILLGVALGSLTAGLRILMGADRPYSG